jgi:hypothetical protein
MDKVSQNTYRCMQIQEMPICIEVSTEAIQQLQGRRNTCGCGFWAFQQ